MKDEKTIDSVLLGCENQEVTHMRDHMALRNRITSFSILILCASCETHGITDHVGTADKIVDHLSIRRLSLVADNGEKRGSLFTNSTGETILELCAGGDSPVLACHAAVDGCGVYIRDDVIRAALAYRNNNPYLRMNDAKGRQRLGAFVRPDGGSGFNLIDDSGKARAYVYVAEDGTPGIVLAGADGFARLTCRLDKEGNVGVVVFDEAQKRRIELSHLVGEKSYLRLSDKFGNERGGLEIDSNGRVILSADNVGK